jgi:hypothetical protein
MMSVTALDTHEVVKTLKAAGFSEEQAEAVTRIVRDSQNVDLSGLATKGDLSEAKVEIIKWVIGIGFAQAGFVIAMLRLEH